MYTHGFEPWNQPLTKLDYAAYNSPIGVQPFPEPCVNAECLCTGLPFYTFKNSFQTMECDFAAWHKMT